MNKTPPTRRGASRSHSKQWGCATCDEDWFAGRDKEWLGLRAFSRKCTHLCTCLYKNAPTSGINVVPHLCIPRCIKKKCKPYCKVCMTSSLKHNRTSLEPRPYLKVRQKQDARERPRIRPPAVPRDDLERQGAPSPQVQERDLPRGRNQCRDRCPKHVVTKLGCGRVEGVKLVRLGAGRREVENTWTCLSEHDPHERHKAPSFFHTQVTWAKG